MVFYLGVVKGRMGFRFTLNSYGLVGAAFVTYALFVYPLLNLAPAHNYPKSPTFGVPCPTAIFTYGLFLWTVGRLPLYLLVVPAVWTLIGSSAIVLLGMWEDIGLLAAGVSGTALVLAKNRGLSHGQNFTLS
jgi:hypothetical protein